MEECKMLKVGDKVVAKKGSNIKELEGKIATVRLNIPIPFLDIDYVIEFDDKDYMKKMSIPSTLCCNKNDIELYNDDVALSFNDTDEILPNGDRLIINGTTTVYLTTRSINGVTKVFRGIARLKDGDVYDKGEGIRIACLKADKKRLETEIKGLEENYIKQLNNKVKYLSKIDKELAKYIGGDN
jgi:hypothetical protein